MQRSADGSELLARVLTDLIEGQGNLAVAVDLGEAIVDPASERGSRYILEKPPIETHEALRARGYGDLVDVPSPGLKRRADQAREP